MTDFARRMVSECRESRHHNPPTYYDRHRTYRRYDDDDYEEAEEDVALSHKELKKWEQELHNADGTMGAHFGKEEVRKVAEHIGVKYDHYEEADLFMATNMLYSDYSEVLRPMIPSDKEVMVYVKLGRAFLEDKDGRKGAEKLAMYYYSIVYEE